MLLPNHFIVHRGWRILTPHGDIVDVFSQPTDCSEGVANFDPS